MPFALIVACCLSQPNPSFTHSDWSIEKKKSPMADRSHRVSCISFFLDRLCRILNLSWHSGGLPTSKIVYSLVAKQWNLTGLSEYCLSLDTRSMSKRFFEGAQHAVRYAATRPSYPPELMQRIIGFLALKVPFLQRVIWPAMHCDCVFTSTKVVMIVPLTLVVAVGRVPNYYRPTFNESMVSVALA